MPNYTTILTSCGDSPKSQTPNSGNSPVRQLQEGWMITPTGLLALLRFPVEVASCPPDVSAGSGFRVKG